MAGIRRGGRRGGLQDGVVEGRHEFPRHARHGRGGEEPPHAPRAPWVQAPSEGEAEAAFLARRGDAWAAGSKDYDSLLFGAPRLVRYLAVRSQEFLPSQGRSRVVPPEILDVDENLLHVGLTRDQLVDAAIVIGTDFNDGVRGFGPRKAVRLLARIGGLENAPKEIRTSLPDNWHEIREFFLNPPVTSDVDLRSRTPDEPGLLRFLCDERGFSRSRLETVIGRLRREGRRNQMSIDNREWA